MLTSHPYSVLLRIVAQYFFHDSSSKYICMDGLVQLLMMLAKPRTKLISTNRNAHYMLIMLMMPKVSEPLLNRIYSINLDKNTCKLH